MKFQNFLKTIASSALFACASTSFAHVVLIDKSAPAGSAYKASFLVGHGCDGSATTGIAVQIPAGFQGAKPYPKSGWTLAVSKAKLAQPYDSHGKQVTEDVSVVTWTAASKDAALQDAYVDEFMLRGTLPHTSGPLWFKVLQTCENGSNDWHEIPASGQSTKGLKSPAVLLEVAGHDASRLAPAMQMPMPMPMPSHGEHQH